MNSVKNLLSEYSKISDLYNSGMSARAISKIYNCDSKVITKILKGLGLEIRSNRKIREDDKNDIAYLYSNGVSACNIAERYNISFSTVHNILREKNIERTDIKIKESQYEEVISLYNNGMSSSEIANKYNISDTTVRKVLHRCGVKMRTPEEYNRIYSVNEHYFDEIDTPNKAYILGLLYADGCNHGTNNGISLKLQERDKSVLEQINIELKNQKPLTFRPHQKGHDNYQDTYAIEIFSKHMSDVLFDKGVVPNKSLILTFPEWLDQNLYSHFLRGYIDGDGHISKDYSKASVSLVSTAEFCDSVAKILENMLGIIEYHIYSPSGKDKNTRTLVVFGQERTKKILDYIYKDAKIYIQRKYNVYQQIISHK